MSLEGNHLDRRGSWSDAELIPLSALQHYAYCPRQCALIHVEQVWYENLYTLRGRRAHERVDEASGEMREGVRIEFALPLFSDRLGLVGKADAVEFDASGVPYPVEHKVGKRSKGAHARHADAVQLCAQALCLEEMFARPVARGAVSYRASRRRGEIEFTDELRFEVEQLTDKVRRLFSLQTLPRPSSDERCRHCSLIETCMPFISEDFESD
jgi:CRISPR-associated exonuclease Cas4